MFSMIIFPALMGWAGGSFTHPLNTKEKREPDPEPWKGTVGIGDPDPHPWAWAIIRVLISIVGGVAGGYITTQFLGVEQLATTGLLAMAGGSILTDLGRQINVVRYL